MKYICILLLAACMFAYVIDSSFGFETAQQFNDDDRWAIPFYLDQGVRIDSLVVGLTAKPNEDDQWYVRISLGETIEAAVTVLPEQSSPGTVTLDGFWEEWRLDLPFLGYTTTEPGLYWLEFYYTTYYTSYSYIRCNSRQPYAYTQWPGYSWSCPGQTPAFILKGEEDVALTRDSWASIKSSF